MTKSATEVFRADEQDAAGIARVHGLARAKAYAETDLVSRGAEPTAAERTALWRDLLAGDQETAFTLVAELRGQAVGFCSVATTARDADLGPHTGEIAALYIEPARWRQGIGGALVTRAQQELRDAGCRAVTLWVLAENAPATTFYARHGFAPDGMGGPDPKTGRPKARLAASL